MNPQYKDFLTRELPAKLRTLSSKQEPNFGLMTAHHMVEHLIYSTKTSSKRKGEPEVELSKSQLYFRQFMDAGAPFAHRPKAGKTKADLNALRTANIEEAILLLENAVAQFYALFESKPEHKSYNPMMGEFSMPELEMFNYQHGRWHLYQFGLLEEFAPLSV